MVELLQDPETGRGRIGPGRWEIGFGGVLRCLVSEAVLECSRWNRPETFIG